MRIPRASVVSVRHPRVLLHGVSVSRSHRSLSRPNGHPLCEANGSQGWDGCGDGGRRTSSWQELPVLGPVCGTRKGPTMVRTRHNSTALDVGKGGTELRVHVAGTYGPSVTADGVQSTKAAPKPADNMTKTAHHYSIFQALSAGACTPIQGRVDRWGGRRY